MLNIIKTSGLSNILVVVTRYFGGILLGTGGLLRAYSEATNSALEKSNIVNMDLGYLAFFEVGYSDIGKAKYYFEQQKIRVVNQNFDTNVKFFVEIVEEKYLEIIENKDELNFKILSFGKIEKKYVKDIDFL